MNELGNPYYLENYPSWGSNQVQGYGDSDVEGSDWQGQGNFDWGKMTQGVQGGLAAGAANSQPNDFQIDQYAGFKSSGEGLMSGGALGAIIGGVTSQVGQFSNLNKKVNAIDTSVNGVTYDAYGRPTYNGQAIGNAQQTIGGLDKGIRKLNKTHLDPATNLFSSAFGSRRKMKRKRAELQNNIAQAQRDYNTADVNYRNQFAAQESYRDNLNNNRMYNLYRFRNG